MFLHDQTQEDGFSKLKLLDVQKRIWD